MLSYEALLRDLGDEQSDLDGVVADLDATGWATPTPAAGWDVRDTIAHLAFSEDLAVLAMTDEGTFETRRGELIAVAETVGDVMVERGRAMTGVEVRDWWREQRARTRSLLAARDAKDRIPWIVGTMSAMSFATGRLMETWRTAKTSPRLSPSSARRQPACVTSPTSVCAPGTSPTGCAAWSRPGRTSRSSWPPLTGPRGRGERPRPTPCAVRRVTSASS